MERNKGRYFLHPVTELRVYTESDTVVILLLGCLKLRCKNIYC
jgi:hypothetical protein